MITLTDLDALCAAGIIRPHMFIASRFGDPAWLRDDFPALPDATTAEAQ